MNFFLHDRKTGKVRTEKRTYCLENLNGNSHGVDETHRNESENCLRNAFFFKVNTNTHSERNKTDK